MTGQLGKGWQSGGRRDRPPGSIAGRVGGRQGRASVVGAWSRPAGSGWSL